MEHMYSDFGRNALVVALILTLVSSFVMAASGSDVSVEVLLERVPLKGG